jgi:ethanolamine ammonia-lyase small subunit
MDTTDLETIVRAVLDELDRTGATATQRAPATATTSAGGELVVDLPDPTEPSARQELGVVAPHDPEGLVNLAASTGARLGVGRAGPRPRTGSLLLSRQTTG